MNTIYFTNHLWDYHKISNFDAVRDKDDLVRLSGQKVKGLRSWSD